MNSIRKLIQNRKEEERRNKTELVAVRKLRVPISLTIHAENVVKFSWDHWFCLDSLDRSRERNESKFFECMHFFKSISHASRFEDWVLVHLTKENTSGSHPPLKYFVEKLRSMGCEEQMVERLTKIQELECNFRESFEKTKKNTQHYSAVGKTLINNLFMKALKALGEAPTLVLGFNIDFDTMKPVLETIAVSNSLLALLQRDPQEFMLECIRNKSIPEIFTNYGFFEWNRRYLDLVERILRSILENGPVPKLVASNVPTVSVRELIDAYDNRIMVEIESGIQIPVLASFKVRSVVCRDDHYISNKAPQPALQEYSKAVNKVLYSYQNQKEYVERHTAGYRLTNL